jgi:hypothetical protein
MSRSMSGHLPLPQMHRGPSLTSPNRHSYTRYATPSRPHPRAELPSQIRRKCLRRRYTIEEDARGLIDLKGD